MAPPSALKALQLAIFDLYQRLDLRERKSTPTLIVAIDEASIAARGQWPCPRSTVAELIDKIAAARPIYTRAGDRNRISLLLPLAGPC